MAMGSASLKQNVQCLQFQLGNLVAGKRSDLARLTTRPSLSKRQHQIMMTDQYLMGTSHDYNVVELEDDVYSKLTTEE